VGKAIPGVEIRIDTSMTRDPENGEIVVYGHNVMKGYHNLPEENAKVFTKDGGFRTGDLGRKDADGFVYITGRIKEQYKLENGKYVAPSPLEEKLKLSPYIANVMVYGDNRPFNVALIVPDMDALRKWASENGRSSADIKALLDDRQLRDVFGEELEKFSADFKQFEKIKKFGLVAEDFTTENDMLTPTLKLKRRKVIEVFGEQLKQLYS
jgi:long-chain acyl-CoA synthetase